MHNAVCITQATKYQEGMVYNSLRHFYVHRVGPKYQHSIISVRVIGFITSMSEILQSCCGGQLNIDLQHTCVMLSGLFINRQWVFLWVLIVFLFSSTCSIIRMRQALYNGFSQKKVSLIFSLSKTQIVQIAKYTFFFVELNITNKLKI